jgi:hypothetical protein
MPRSVDKDLLSLEKFISDYSLSSHLLNSKYKTNLKQAHKTYFVLLTLFSALEYEMTVNMVTFSGVKIKVNDSSHLYLSESISDFGNALFCCLHGSYKSGQVALRSCIENFVRAIAGLHDVEALSTTSVYQLFIIASKTASFQKLNAPLLSNIKGEYSNLCKYTHTATPMHMASIRSLEHFPAYNAQGFSDWIKSANLSMKNINSCIINLCPNLYLDAHFKTKEILDLGFLNDTIRLRVLGAT